MAEQNFFDTKTIIIAVLGIAVAGLLYFNYGTDGASLTGQKAAEAALSYINTEMLQGQAAAEIDGEVKKVSGVYMFNVSLNGESFPTYVSKDGKLLFPQGIEMIVSTTSDENTNTEANPPATCEEVAKTESPQLEAFIVSYCPYGLQMQRVITEIINKIPELAQDIKIRYMGEVVDGKITSMHGDQEAQENLRQICLREEQPTKFNPYLSCFIQKGEADNCLTTAQIDITGLTSCMTDPTKGLAYAQVDFTEQNTLDVTGSPSLFLGGVKQSEFNFGGRTAQGVKTLLCCGFNEVLNACQTELSTEQAASSFSETYSGGAGATNSAAECE
ncbi:hypothetical protein L6252_02515 [Candidatus Parcubacteria bacterium]|nr:hypothetical protein [Candidatus Parcubacteria bacterium]